MCRGVPVDEWMYKESTRDSEDRTNITGRFSVHLYFSTPEWHFGRSNGYRTLQRVALKGRRNVVNGTVRLSCCVLQPNMRIARCHASAVGLDSLLLQLCRV